MCLVINIDVLTKALSDILSDKYDLNIKVTAVPKKEIKEAQEPQGVQDDREDAA